MRTGCTFFLCLILLHAMPFDAYGYSVLQTEWSDGPGVSGPVTHWYGYFSDQSNMGWYTIPSGELYLGITGITHPISSDLAVCRFAFPADMDGDGDIDVISSERGSPSPYKVAWFENDGSGGGWNMHIVSQNYALFYCVYPGDLDNDGDMDIVGANTAMSKEGLEWFSNDDGVGDSWTRYRIEYWGSSFFVCCSDIDGDDTLDVVANTWGDPDQIAWWERHAQSEPEWEQHVVTGGVAFGRELFCIDLDQDGDIDILNANEWHNGLKWYENLDGTGLNWSIHGIGGYYNNPYSVHASDIDCDGDLDVIYCSDQYAIVAWFENVDGSCTNWEEHIIDTERNHAYGVHSVDLTQDGYPDVILAESDGKHLYLYRNMDGAGTQWARFLIKSGWWFRDVDVADFDEDGKLDILAAAELGTSISWYEIQGESNGWLLSSILDVGSYPQWDSITWIGDEPLGTDIFFQVRASNDWEDMGAWCDTIFEPQSLTGIIDSTFRYIQYRVGMTSDTEFLSPTLEQVRFFCTYLGIEGGEESTEFSISVHPNPSTGSVSIMTSPVLNGEAEICIYDISGKLVRRFGDLDTNIIQWDCDDESGREVPSGVYLIQGISGTQSLSMRFVKI